MNIETSGEVKELLEARGIREEEVKEVIQHSESSGEKLYQPEHTRYLGKLRISEASVYVEYYVEYGYQVRRILYIEDVIYTISEAKVKMNDMETLQLLNEVEL